MFVSARIQLKPSAPSAVQTAATVALKRLRTVMATLDRMRPGAAAVRAAKRHIAANDSSITLGGFPLHPNTKPGEGPLHAASALSLVSGNGAVLEGMQLPAGMCVQVHVGHRGGFSWHSVLVMNDVYMVTGVTHAVGVVLPNAAVLNQSHACTVLLHMDCNYYACIVLLTMCMPTP